MDAKQIDGVVKAMLSVNYPGGVVPVTQFEEAEALVKEVRTKLASVNVPMSLASEPEAEAEDELKAEAEDELKAEPEPELEEPKETTVFEELEASFTPKTKVSLRQVREALQHEGAMKTFELTHRFGPGVSSVLAHGIDAGILKYAYGSDALRQVYRAATQEELTAGPIDRNKLASVLLEHLHTHGPQNTSNLKLDFSASGSTINAVMNQLVSTGHAKRPVKKGGNWELVPSNTKSKQLTLLPAVAGTHIWEVDELLCYLDDNLREVKFDPKIFAADFKVPKKTMDRVFALGERVFLIHKVAQDAPYDLWFITSLTQRLKHAQEEIKKAAAKAAKKAVAVDPNQLPPLLSATGAPLT